MERICAPAPGVKRRRKQTPDSGAIQGAQEIQNPQPENRGKKKKKKEHWMVISRPRYDLK